MNLMHLSIHGVSIQYWAVQGTAPQHAQPFHVHLAVLSHKVITSRFKVYCKQRSKLFPGNFRLDRIIGGRFL